MLKVKIFDSISFGYLFIIALIVIFQPSDEIYSQLGQIFLFLIIALIIGFVISYFLSRFGIVSLGKVIFDRLARRDQLTDKSLRKKFWQIHLIILFITTFIVGYYMSQINLYELSDIEGLLGMRRIVIALLSPDWAILPEGMRAILETIFIAFMATLLAVPIAFIASFLCAKNIMGSSVLGFSIYILLRTLFNITRSIEPLIWAIIFTVWVGIGPFAGMLGLMLHSVAALAKQYSELIECVEDGPIEGITSTGARPLQVIWFAIFPQVLLPYISFTIYRWDINVRMATLVGIMGGGGIGTLLVQSVGLGLWREVGCLTILIVIAVWSLDTTSTYIREALK